MAKNYLTVKSFSNDNRTYHLTRAASGGHITCTCPAYAFSTESPKTCKHIQVYGWKLGERKTATLTVTVQMDNASFTDGAGELENLLGKVAAAVEDGHTAGALRDLNGNTVCRYEVK